VVVLVLVLVLVLLLPGLRRPSTAARRRALDWSKQ
jgi:hypothetical protein